MCKNASVVLTSQASRQAQQLDVEALQGVANARFALALIAKFMFMSGSEDREGPWQKEEIRRGLKVLFDEARRMCCETQNSPPHIYLLKQLVRRFGLDSVKRLSKRNDLKWILPPENGDTQVSAIIQPESFYCFMPSSYEKFQIRNCQTHSRVSLVLQLELNFVPILETVHRVVSLNIMQRFLNLRK